MKHTCNILKLLLISSFLLSSIGIKAGDVQKESIWFVTDRNVYSTGEIIQYKLYLQDAATKHLSDLSSIAYLVIRGIDKAPFFNRFVEIKSGIASGTIQIPDTLNSGLYQILVFTNAMRNEGEYTYFRHKILIVNRFDDNLNFKIPEIKSSQETSSKNQFIISSVEKTTFQPREKVTLHLQSINSNANLAISVTENSQFNFDEDEDNTFNQKHTPLLPIEKEGKILSGMVYDQETNQPVENAVVVLSRIDTIANLQYYKTGADGKFEMPLLKYYGGKKLYLTIQNIPDDRQWRLKADDPFYLNNPWNPTTRLSLNNDLKNYLTETQKIADINIAYYPDENINREGSILETEILPKFYNCIPTTVKPSDYTSLDNFREISVEILPFVRFYKDKGRSKISVWNKNQINLIKNSETSVFLDGVYLDDMDKLSALNSDKIKKIEIVYNQRAFDNCVYDGALSVFTKHNEIDKMNPDPFSLILDDESASKTYTTKNDVFRPTPKSNNLPFFKQLLYWNPNLNLEKNKTANIEFYAPDNTGVFNLNIKGITDDGKIINEEIKIQVTN